MSTGARAETTAAAEVRTDSITGVVAACDEWKKTPDFQNFGRVILAARALLPTQSEWTLRFGVGASTRSRWEQGLARPARLVQEQVVTDLRELAKARLAPVAAVSPETATSQSGAAKGLRELVRDLGRRLRRRATAQS
jgi:hypothetical protein